MKFSKIENLYTTLSSLKDKELPFRLAYKFSKILDSIESDYEFYTSQIRKIIFKYAEKDENGNPIQVENGIQLQKEYTQTANKELENVANEEFDLPEVILTVEELEPLNITPSELRALLPFIEE